MQGFQNKTQNLTTNRTIVKGYGTSVIRKKDRRGSQGSKRGQLAEDKGVSCGLKGKRRLAGSEKKELREGGNRSSAKSNITGDSW